ncbi:MAG: alpha/beta hydrolase [Gammaproteobacteria bacterium]|nr:alpha/beta hydrolase [Gammaproteobacteria bacterium]
MNIKRIVALMGVVFFMGSVNAEEVKLNHNGISISAELVMAAGKTVKDTIIVMTHGTLAHNKMEIMTQLQNLFKDNEISSLSVNLGLGINERKGMYDCATSHTHKHTDAVEEIGLWLNWLKSKGADNIVLLGHSRGGNQTAWFASETDDKVIKKVILIAPMTWSEDYAVTNYKKRYKKELAPILAKAELLVKQGKGQTVLNNTDHIYCENTSVTAESFVSYNKPDQRFNTPYLLDKIKQPVLVFAGSADTTVKDLDKKVAPYLAKGKVDLAMIDGAGHMFRDLYAEDVVDQVVEFINAE